MSLPNALRMGRNAQEVLDLLSGNDERQGVSMPFEVATDIDSKLRGIVALADDVDAEQRFLTGAFEVIEGLLANWPTTEALEHYQSGAGAVLMKDEALKRAGEIVTKFRAEYI